MAEPSHHDQPCVNEASPLQNTKEILQEDCPASEQVEPNQNQAVFVWGGEQHKTELVGGILMMESGDPGNFNQPLETVCEFSKESMADLTVSKPQYDASQKLIQSESPEKSEYG